MTALRSLIATILIFGATLPAPAFELTSTDIHPGKPMPKAQEFNGFGCDGDNLSPQLAWKNPPAGTQSYAITVYDPDAPTGSGWWHWTVANLPANTTSLPQGAGGQPKLLPAGAVQGRTDFGQPGFGGACPPQGDKPHRYQFTVWALKTLSLPVDEQASGALFGYMIRANAIGKASLTATYRR